MLCSTFSQDPRASLVNLSGARATPLSRRVYVQNAPCVHSKRPRVYRHHARKCYERSQAVRSRQIPVQGEFSRCQRLTRRSLLDPVGKGLR